MPSSRGDSSKSLRIAPFSVSQLGIIITPAGWPTADPVDDTGGTDLGLTLARSHEAKLPIPVLFSFQPHFHDLLRPMPQSSARGCSATLGRAWIFARVLAKSFSPFQSRVASLPPRPFPLPP